MDNARMNLQRVAMLLVVLFVPIDSLSSAQAPTTLAQGKPARQAVIDTTIGTIVLDLLAEQAPNHVALFVKTAESGGYNGTTFFRMIKYGIIQGGDPMTKDPAARPKYGSGGLNLLKPEISAEKQTRGAVSATLIPG